MAAGPLEGVPIQIVFDRSEWQQKKCEHRNGKICQQKFCPRYLTYCITPAHCKYRLLPRNADPDKIGQYGVQLKQYSEIVALKETERLGTNQAGNPLCPGCRNEIGMADFVFPVFRLDRRNEIYLGISSIGAFYCGECKRYITTKQSITALNEKLKGKTAKIKLLSLDELKKQLANRSTD